MEDLLNFLKKGSGIHIKKKNRGKFTSYCGGKVTDECIRRGKNSSSATIRKRATFAANARRWKHKDGGILKGQGGLTFPNMGFINPAMAAIPYMQQYNNPNANAGSIVQGYYNNIQNQEFARQMQRQKELDELELKKLKMQKQNQMFDTLTNLGGTLLTTYLNNRLSKNAPTTQ